LFFGPLLIESFTGTETVLEDESMEGFPSLVPSRRRFSCRTALLFGIALSILCVGIGCGDFTLFGDDDQGVCDPDPCASKANATAGTCTAVDESDFTCDCDAGYFWEDDGNTCEDPCASDPCDSIENAVDSSCEGVDLDDFTCECDAEYFWKDNGNTCENPCASDPCDSIENAVDGSCEGVDADNYACDCDAGFVWYEDSNTCVEDPCDPDPCEGIANAEAGSCEAQGENDYTCDCDAGYFWEDVGNTCEDPCASDPCDGIPNAEASSCIGIDADDFTCDCDTGYTWDSGSNVCAAEAVGTCADLKNCLSGCSGINDFGCLTTCYATWTGCDCVLDTGALISQCAGTCFGDCIDIESKACWDCVLDCGFDTQCQ